MIRYALLIGLVVAIPVSAQETPERANLWVRVTETDIFGDLHLDIKVQPAFDVKQTELDVTIAAQGDMGDCTYSNSAPIWSEDEKYHDTAAGLSCLMGAQFPIRRIASVSAEVGGGLFSKGRTMKCHVAAVSKTQPSGVRTYACNWEK